MVNAADCVRYLAHDNPAVQVKWSWTDKPETVTDPIYAFKLAGEGKSCNSNDLAEASSDECKVISGSTKFAASPSTLNQTSQFSLKDLLVGVDCAAAKDAVARIYFVVGDGDPQSVSGQPGGLTLNVNVDLTVPAPPTISEVTSHNGSLAVTLSHAKTEDGQSARIYWSETASVASSLSVAAFKSSLITDNTYTIKDLDNGTQVHIVATTVDLAGNESAPSALSSGAPARVQDFWRYYKNEGGQAEGDNYGCQVGKRSGGGGGVLFVALALLLSLRNVWTRRPSAVASPGAGPQAS